MPRCRSWRPTTLALTVGKPGRDRVNWKPCHTKVDVRGLRCEECYQLLATHPDARVRAALAKESNVPDWVIQILATDPDPAVFLAVRDRIPQIATIVHAEVADELWADSETETSSDTGTSLDEFVEWTEET